MLFVAFHAQIINATWENRKLSLDNRRLSGFCKYLGKVSRESVQSIEYVTLIYILEIAQWHLVSWRPSIDHQYSEIWQNLTRLKKLFYTLFLKIYVFFKIISFFLIILYKNSKIIRFFRISCNSKLSLNYLLQSEVINIISNIQYTNNFCNK